jgi:TRAP-type mannitol/chloroaromatic compound transport system substrate-binding protein
MTNVFLQNPEVYEGLQRGVAVCNLNTPATYMNDGLWEIAKYWLPIPASASVGVGYVISKNTWDTLPPVAQNIINEAKAAISVNFLKNAATANQRWIDEAPGRGVEFIDVPQEMIDVLKDVQGKRGSELANTAPDLVTSPQSEIDATKRYYDQWVGILSDEFGITEPSYTPQRLLDALRSTPSKVDWNRYQQRFTQFLLN